MAGPSLHNTQCSSPTLYTHTVYIQLDVRRHACRQRGAGKERGRIDGGRDGGSNGWEGGRDGGRDDVRQGGSGSGGREGVLREVWLIIERASKGRNEAWTEGGKVRREEASGRRKEGAGR